MNGWIVCGASPASGLRHRFTMLSRVKAFAEQHDYAVTLLWGATRGVAFCRFEELLAPLPGVRVINVSEHHLSEILRAATNRNRIRLGNQEFQIFRPGRRPVGNIFSWDLVCSAALARLNSSRRDRIVSTPSASIRAQTEAYARRYAMARRIGIRVRVEEFISRDRKPHRLKPELDEVVRSIIRIPWYTRVFVVTDSEYIQQMLATHFADCVFLPKNFDLKTPTGRYIFRQDKDAMVTFLKEVECLCRCEKVINIGGFLNEDSVRHKLLKAPYKDTALLQLKRH